jgi:hypothetical protein
LQLNYAKEDEVATYIRTKISAEQKERLGNLFNVIEGFETTLSLEILSSTHYLLSENPNANEDELLDRIQTWNDRKKNLISKDYINIAVEHLHNYGSKLHFV